MITNNLAGIVCKTFENSLVAAKQDGFTWINMRAGERTYFVMIEKLQERIKDDHFKILRGQMFIYNKSFGSIRREDCNGTTQYALFLHPHPIHGLIKER